MVKGLAIDIFHYLTLAEDQAARAARLCAFACPPTANYSLVLQGKDVVGKSAFVVKGISTCVYEDDEDSCRSVFDLHFR